jgi:hypothetical protein
MIKSILSKNKRNVARKNTSSALIVIEDELLTIGQPQRPSTTKTWSATCKPFGNVPIKYDHREQAFAQAYPFQRSIRVGPSFFNIKTKEDKVLVLGHEFGHFFEKLIIYKNKTPSYFTALQNSGIFGKAKGRDFEGIYGLTSLKEAIAEGYGMYVSPVYSEFLKEDYPQTYEFIDKYFK